MSNLRSPFGLMMIYHPPCYADLAHLCGYRKEEDLVAYAVGRDTPMPLLTFDLGKRITRLRGVIFGVKEAHRQMGLPFFVLNHLLRVLEHKGRYRTIELGSDLEDNNAINFLYQKGGLRVEKHWHLFRKALRV